MSGRHLKKHWQSICELLFSSGTSAKDSKMMSPWRRFGAAAMLIFTCFFSGEACSQAQGKETLTTEESGWHRIQPGDRFVYRMEYRNSLTTNPLPPMFGGLDRPDSADDPSASPQQTFSTTVRGTLDLLILEKREDRFFASYAFPKTQAAFFTDSGKDPYTTGTLQQALGKKVLGVLDTSGRVMSIRFSPDTDPFSRNLTKVLLAWLQFSSPEVPPEKADRWEATEADPSGRYIAQYRRVSPVSFRKEKLEYLPKPTRRTGTRIEISPDFRPSGNSTVVFSLTKGCIESLSGEETLEAFIGESQLARSRTKVQFKLEKRMRLSGKELERHQKLALGKEAAYVAEKITEQSGKRESELARWRQTLGNDTADSLLARLRNLDESESDSSEQTSLFLKLRVLASLDPEGCRKIGKAVFAGSPSSVAFRLLTASYAASGSEAAQEALAGAIRDHGSDPEALFPLILALSQVANPTTQSVKAIGGVAFDPTAGEEETSLALLAYGAMAGSLENSDPPRAGEMLDRLLAGLDSAPGFEKTRIFVGALGNTGSTKAFPALLRLSSDPSPKARGAALMAMRLIDTKDADQALFGALASDPDFSVRRAAASSLGFREMTDSRFRAQKSAIKKEEEASIRITLLNNLWSAREAFPATFEIVEEAAENDPSPDIRDYAARLLGKPVEKR